MIKYGLRTNLIKSVTLYCKNCNTKIFELDIDNAHLIYGYKELQKPCRKCGAKLLS